MKKNMQLIVSVMAVGALLVLAGPAFAHHGSAAYDMSKTITVTGTVTDFQFINPHVLIMMEVKNPTTGKMEKWAGELTSPNRLSRDGWTKSTVKVGDVLTWTGGPSKTGAPTMWIRKIEKNGEDLPIGMGDN
jgi:hypothetical protein